MGAFRFRAQDCFARSSLNHFAAQTSPPVLDFGVQHGDCKLSGDTVPSVLAGMAGSTYITAET
jgi:hypothetical protein